MELIQDTVDLAPRNLGLGGRGAHLVIPSVIGSVLATILVFNRVYWRIALVHILGLDDLCITLSLVFLYLLCIVNIVAVDHGYGRPSRFLLPSDLHTTLQMFYLDQIFYKFSINLTKLSILCLYLRIFSQPWFRRTCWASVVVILAYALASIVATVFQCTPIAHFWDKTTYPAGTCINVTAFWYANAIYNIVTDIVILASVPGVVWTLRLPLRQRLGLTVVFGLGVFVCATSVLRMTTLDRSSRAADPTAGTLVSTMWTTIEASSAVVCACLPMVRTPVQRLVPRLFPSQGASGTGAKAKGKGVPAVGGKGGPIVGAGGRVVEVERSPKSEDDQMMSDEASVGSETREGDLEMGGLGHGGTGLGHGGAGLGQGQGQGIVMQSQQSWPRRESSIQGLDSLTLGSKAPISGHKRLLSESSGCASPTKLEDW